MWQGYCDLLQAIQERLPVAAKEEAAQADDEAAVEDQEAAPEAEEGSSSEEAVRKSPWSWVKFLTGKGHGDQAGDVGATPGSGAAATGGEAGLAQRYQVGTLL